MSKRKNTGNPGNLNADFCDFLLELADYEKNVGRNIFKHNAYKKAASVLTAHPKRIESGDEAKKLPGIGASISKKIDEFLQTGKLRKLEQIEEDDDAKAICCLTKVSGIGPVKAAELLRQGIRTIKDLEDNKDKLNHHQLIGLKYYDDFLQKIPRNEVKDIEKILKTTISDVDKELTVTICGSYRRGKAECGDIDVLITHPALKATPTQGKRTNGKKPPSTYLNNVIEALEKTGLVTDTMSLGESKYMGVCRLNDKLPARRLDIRLFPSEQYYCAVLHYTGSDEFNRMLRANALERHFSLNEYRLRVVGSAGVLGDVIPISSEEEIFDRLNMPFKKPEERSLRPQRSTS